MEWGIGNSPSNCFPHLHFNRASSSHVQPVVRLSTHRQKTEGMKVRLKWPEGQAGSDCDDSQEDQTVILIPSIKFNPQRQTSRLSGSRFSFRPYSTYSYHVATHQLRDYKKGLPIKRADKWISPFIGQGRREVNLRKFLLSAKVNEVVMRHPKLNFRSFFSELNHLIQI